MLLSAEAVAAQETDVPEAQDVVGAVEDGDMVAANNNNVNNSLDIMNMCPIVLAKIIKSGAPVPIIVQILRIALGNRELHLPRTKTISETPRLTLHF